MSSTASARPCCSLPGSIECASLCPDISRSIRSWISVRIRSSRSRLRSREEVLPRQARSSAKTERQRGIDSPQLRSQKCVLTEILDQHEDAARVVRLRVNNRSAVGGNRDVVTHRTLNFQNGPDLTGGEFVKADVIVSHFVGNSKEVNPLLPHSPLAFAIHRIENLRFLISIHRGSPDGRLWPVFHVVKEFAVC